ncbi:MAG: PGF-CTERM-anchored ABC transporter substrate-binding protein [Halorubrum sp.]
MRRPCTLVVALFVTTALVGGVSGAVAGAQPTIDGPSGEGTYHGDDPNETESCEFPLELTDATGETVTLEEPPDRITTTNPSAAQTVWELSEQDRVVGVTQFAFYLDGAAERTNVSGDFGADVERVVGTEPDLVLSPNASAGSVDPLREAGLTVYHFPAATSVDDIGDKTTTIGKLLGACEAAADTNEEMYAAVGETEERTADFDRPAALYPLGDGFVAANNTFIDEIMRIGGVDNVAAAEGDGFPQLSDEVVLATDPELILVTDPDAAILDEEPYASTTAGQDRNFVVMNVNYLNQPAPRSVIASTQTLADAVETLQTAETEDATDEETTESEDGTNETAGDGDEAAVDEETAEEADDVGVEVPGFGVVPAVVAALAAALLAIRRRN